MLPMLKVLVFAIAITALSSATALAAVTGTYLEARTCQVYTGPCFANGEVGLTGNDAMMAWSVEKGEFDDVDISGLNVVVAICASGTLAFQGIDDAREIKTLILVDNRASTAQQAALVEFVKKQIGKAGENVVRIDASPIQMSLDTFDLNGKLNVGKSIEFVIRKARPGDCICSNEIAYYPPLVKIKHFAPGVTTEGDFSAKGLGTSWSIPGSRSAYMGMFSF